MPEPTVIAHPFTESVFIFILISAVIYALVYRSSPTRFTSLLRCANDRNLTDQLFRENNRIVNRTLSILVVLGVSSIGLFMSWSAYKTESLAAFELGTAFFGVLTIALLVTLRFTALSCLGAIFQKQNLTDQMLFSLWVILAFLGPATLVLTAFAVFSPLLMQSFFVWVGLVLLLLAYLIFLVKSLLLSIQEKGIGPLNLIYYFCALEIMPVLLAYRTLLS